MKRTIEAVGKKVEDAIAEGLKQLNATIDEVDVKIISQGGFLKKAKVELTIGEDDPILEKQEKPLQTAPKPQQKPVQKSEQKPEQKPVQKSEQKSEQKPVQKSEQKSEQKPVQKSEQKFEQKPVQKSEQKLQAFQDKPNQNKIQKFNDKKFDRPRDSAPVTKAQMDICESFLKGLLTHMGIDGNIIIKENNGIDIIIDTKDSTVIGRRGEVLDALQYLTSLVLNDNGGRNVHISLDALGYREGRIETLKNLALRMADKCITQSRKVLLDPMSSSERRVIHAALSENDKVITKSEGKEPNRRIVILPANDKK